MEPPISFDADTMRRERVKVWQRDTADSPSSDTVRGQYDRVNVCMEKSRRYR